MLTADKSWYEYDKDHGRNNYKEAIVIGQFIRVQLYGPKNSKGKHTTMVEFSGNACREFLGRGGKYLDLMIHQ